MKHIDAFVVHIDAFFVSQMHWHGPLPAAIAESIASSSMCELQCILSVSSKVGSYR